MAWCEETLCSFRGAILGSVRSYIFSSDHLFSSFESCVDSPPPPRSPLCPTSTLTILVEVMRPTSEPTLEM